MFSISSSNAVRIDGAMGKYNESIPNANIRYGRNAIDNLARFRTVYYLNSGNGYFDSDNVTLTYSPNENLNINALMGASYEALEKNEKVKVANFAQQYSNLTDISFEASYDFAKKVDLNRDGYIDIAENASKMLLEDSNSQPDGEFRGKITSYGVSITRRFLTALSREYGASTALQNICDDLNLKKAQKDFLSEKNKINLVG